MWEPAAVTAQWTAGPHRAKCKVCPWVGKPRATREEALADGLLHDKQHPKPSVTKEQAEELVAQAREARRRQMMAG